MLDRLIRTIKALKAEGKEHNEEMNKLVEIYIGEGLSFNDALNKAREVTR